MDFAFQIVILIMSVVIHEVSHGYAASMLGDETARYEGRLTLNPFKHLDLFGSILLPLFLALVKAPFIFGWAKPVPYNPYNLRPGRWSEAIVAVAGPASNVLIAAVFSIVFRLGLGSLADATLGVITLVIYINLLLAIFNLIPVPPLDGSKVVFALFPQSLNNFRRIYEQLGLILIILVILFAWGLISPLVSLGLALFAGPEAIAYLLAFLQGL